MMLLKLLIALGALVTTSGFSAVAPPPSLASKGLLSPLLDNVQRYKLKRQLLVAAKEKNEASVTQLVDELSNLNPTAVPTLGLKGYGGAGTGPLDGPWRLLYTNAPDAEAPARTEKNKAEPFGEAPKSGVQITTGQRIDATKGECVNFIYASGEERPFDQLEITIEMTPLSDTRVRLDFLRGRALNEMAPLEFLKDFRFNFPPAAIGDALAFLRGKDPKVEPPAYFDVLYIDDEIRAHRTGEGKIFVQQRGK